MIKTTNKDIKSRFYIINTGYCNLQDLLNQDNKMFYNCGVYGFNWRAYIYGNIAFIDGYRNFPKADYEVTHEKMRKYNDIGELINRKYLWQDTDKKNALKEKLIYRLIRELKR